MKSIYILIILTFIGIKVKSQTIADYLSMPFPSDLIASKSGNIIAWKLNSSGERNIFLARAPLYEAEAILEGGGDNGIDINQLSFTADEKFLFYVRGNSPNKKGELANPALVNGEVDRNIYMYDLAKSTNNKLSPGYSPLAGPNGSEIVFIKEGKLWHSDLSTGNVSLLINAKGVYSQLRWSPDGNKLAFVETREDHSMIGIYNFKDKSVNFLMPGLDLDSSPAWSPDGSKLAFLRQPAIYQKIIFTPIRSSQPFSIVLHDFVKDKTSTIWTAGEGPGSFLTDQVYTATHALNWSAFDQLIFPYEKNGWHQLYALDLNTKSLEHLTKGDGEVEYAVMSGDKKSIYVVSNIGDIDRKHVSTVDLASKQHTFITSGNGIEWLPYKLNENKWAMMRSGHDIPAWPVLFDGNSYIRLGSKYMSNAFPKNLRSPIVVKITATDGQVSTGQLFLPVSYNGKNKYPAVIFLHGGSRRQMLLGFHPTLYYSHAYALNQYFASRGYIVLSLNFRSGTGYGLNFREALDYGATGASEVQDLLGAGFYLKNRQDVDGSKISLWGGSYGGYLTAHGLSQASDLFHCGVDIHGVHDWNNGISVFNSWYDPLTMPDFARKAFDSSPLKHIDKWKSPVLLIHGDDDRNVNFSQSVILAEQLRKGNVYMEQLVLPGEIHSFLLHKNWVKVYEACFDFINRGGKQKLRK